MRFVAAVLNFSPLPPLHPGSQNTVRISKIPRHPAIPHHIPKGLRKLHRSHAVALHSARPIVEALIPTITNIVYRKLLGYGITAKALIPRQTGYDGVAPTKLEELGLEHSMVKFRMGFMKRCLQKLVVVNYDNLRTW